MPRPAPLATALALAAIAPSLAACSPRTAVPADAGPADAAPTIAKADGSAADASTPPKDAAASDEAGIVVLRFDGGIVFDLGADFSFAQNPNGAWRYGYTTASALGIGQFKPWTRSRLPTPVFSDGGTDPIDFSGTPPTLRS